MQVNSVLIYFMLRFTEIVSVENSTIEILDKIFDKSKYDPEEPPIPAPKKAVTSYFYVRIVHIEDINESEGTMTLHGIYYQSWYDHRIKWHATAAGIPKYITINQKNHYYRIWKPKIQLGNAASGVEYRLYSEKDVIYSMGLVYVKRKFSIKTNCHFDFSGFPKDHQICPLVFWQQNTIADVTIKQNYTNSVVKTGSWRDKDGGGHVLSGHWKFVTLATKIKYFGWNGLTSGDADPEKVRGKQYLSTIVEVFVEVKRHDPYIGVIVFMPLIMTCVMTILGLFVGDDKLSIVLLLSAFLVETMGLWGLQKKLPPVNGNVPAVVTAYGLAMCLVIVGLVQKLGFIYFLEANRVNQINNSHQATQADQDQIDHQSSAKYINILRYTIAIIITIMLLSSMIILYA